MADLTIAEIQLKKKEIEDNIRKMLSEFEAEAGLFVKWMDMERTDEDFNKSIGERGPIKKIELTLQIADTMVL